jgi:hypothetical protein
VTVDINPIRLDTLANGAAAELFEEELQRVLRNIKDPNTDPKAKRKITLTFEIAPTESRDVGDVHIIASSKIAAFKRVQTVIHMGHHGGRLVAVESNPKQLLLDAAPPAPVAIDSRKDKA